MSSEETCAVCGRTILAGEQTRAYVSQAGRRDVCELCVPRAERLGWEREREGMPAALPAPEKRGLFGGLLRRRPKRRPADPEAELPEDEAVEAADEHEEHVEREPTPLPEPPRRGDPAAPGRRPQRLDPEPTLLSPFERAVARFNASEASRTVAGLVRTLGPPWVSVGASAGAPKEIRITVAWELSWYQWGVDLGDELRPVFPIDKGLEMDQLDTAARQWNASAAEGGRIVLVAPARRPSPDGAGAR
ncbi:MAG TPA: hypothetical protein VHA54_00695 [Solirubrobacterales bacterium]|nr:hypothetical protein [Solirubrobacterales bacterium]